MDRGGFDAFVGNPPFLGGIRIRGVLSVQYLQFLRACWGGGDRADLCGYFFRRAQSLVRDNGIFGLLATNTIAQGDTREFAIEHLLAEGCTIIRAFPSKAWPGTASLEVAQVWMQRGSYNGAVFLDDKEVPEISSHLAIANGFKGKPMRLAMNAGCSFKGSDPLGIGFVIEAQEAQELIHQNRENATVVLPFLNGEDLNSRLDQSASRWAICFFNWPLDHNEAPEGYDGPVASDYPECLAIVEERVKPQRQRQKPNGEYMLRRPLPQKWWIYNCPRVELYLTIGAMKRVLVRPEVSNTHAMVFCPTGIIFSNKLCIFAFEDSSHFGVMQSNIHEAWARFYGSTMRTDMSYTTIDCFETFPFPKMTMDLEDVSDSYHNYRQQIILVHQEGLTKTYNRFHKPDETTPYIKKLRDLHTELDNAVTDAYGWNDLELSHGFYETNQGIRFTISESTRREVLGRLLKLNHERYEEEVRQGLHDKSKAKKAGTKRRRRSSPSSNVLTLFGPSDEASEPEEVLTND
jgi:hypothetical protein